MSWKSKGARGIATRSLLTAAVTIGSATLAHAQGAPGRTIIEGSGVIGAGKTREQINARPTRTSEPLTLGDWLFYPVLDVGYLYNDNVYSSQYNKVSSSGLRIQPSFVARRNTGIHDTTLYAAGDAQFYDHSNANQFTGVAGITHSWEIRRDLVARVQAEYGRFSSLGTIDRLTPQKTIFYNQGYLSASLIKSFDRFFIAGGGSVTDVNYASHRYVDGTTYNVLTRFGYQVTPILYAYVEPSYNWVRNKISLTDSNGYSVVGGLGSDRIGLYTFRVYGGYNEQSYSDPRFGSFSGPTFGGSATWEALRTLKFIASVNHSLGLAGGQVVGPNYSRIVNRTSGSLGASYEITRQLTASATGTVDRESYSGLNRVDNIYSAVTSLNYMFTRHLGISASYTFTKVNSNVPGASFTQNLFTLGGRTQF